MTVTETSAPRPTSTLRRPIAAACGLFGGAVLLVGVLAWGWSVTLVGALAVLDLFLVLCVYLTRMGCARPGTAIVLLVTMVSLIGAGPFVLVMDPKWLEIAARVLAEAAFSGTWTALAALALAGLAGRHVLELAAIVGSAARWRRASEQLSVAAYYGLLCRAADLLSIRFGITAAVLVATVWVFVHAPRDPSLAAVAAGLYIAARLTADLVAAAPSRRLESLLARFDGRLERDLTAAEVWYEKLQPAPDIVFSEAAPGVHTRSEPARQRPSAAPALRGSEVHFRVAGGHLYYSEPPKRLLGVILAVVALGMFFTMVLAPAELSEAGLLVRIGATALCFVLGGLVGWRSLVALLNRRTVRFDGRFLTVSFGTVPQPGGTRIDVGELRALRIAERYVGDEDHGTTWYDLVALHGATRGNGTRTTLVPFRTEQSALFLQGKLAECIERTTGAVATSRARKLDAIVALRERRRAALASSA